jgi:uncharacterized protein YodC (DUF2158 family)
MLRSRFKVGDLVVLKDGGPPMKVHRIGADNSGHTTVTCHWFVEGATNEAEFRPGQLRGYTPVSPDVANPPLGS